MALSILSPSLAKTKTICFQTKSKDISMIKPIGLFHTPKNWDELMEWIHAHTAEEKAHLTTAAAMAWNLAAAIIKENKDDRANQ